MTPEAFQALPAPAPSWSDPLLALWQDANLSWDASHDTLQHDETPEGAWVHAYLHRKEGDLGNAAYWYRRAGQPMASGPLETEWIEIARALLG
jgi:hypothetical protein